MLGQAESNDRNPLVIQLQIWKKKVISVVIFELVVQFSFNEPFELNFG